LHLDERSSAFYALGLARATGRPVAVLCTSGTAAANFFPAIAEANLSRVPLVVCTTDRPPRLRGVGAPQTMDQAGLYTTHVRSAVDLDPPSGDESDAARFAAHAERAVRDALGMVAGPVHVNLPFDEPLLAPPAAHPLPEPVAAGSLPGRPLPSPAAEDVRAAASELARRKRPLIVAGPETGGLPAAAIARLAEALNAPVFADPLSGLRTGAHDRSRICDSYDATLRDGGALVMAPDAVIRFGAAPTSKALNQYMTHVPTAFHLVVDLPGSSRDPLGLRRHRLEGDPGLVADALASALAGSQPPERWAQAWVGADRRAGKAMRDAALGFARPFEGRVFVELQEALPEGAAIFAGNSMPVRDLDSFLSNNEKRLELVANRGVNGIDGVVSSALGTAAAGRGPVALVIGDVSFYHDLNGLWAAKHHGLDLTVVLVNNNGGGIFHYLPQAEHEHLFETWFGTPTGLDFRPAVEMYGGRFTRAADWATFRAALGEAKNGGLHVIELPTDRAANAAMHREAWKAAGEAAWRPVALEAR
ncbi:MAG: 2-succinyl-5-enolpyruvyl-6-hydroxy-3-cyclohexene-1-carboxylic-acid synthase, partial [Hyphomicrobiales bacterium]